MTEAQECRVSSIRILEPPTPDPTGLQDFSGCENEHLVAQQFDAISDETWVFKVDQSIDLRHPPSKKSFILQQEGQRGQDLDHRLFDRFGHFIILNAITNQIEAFPSNMDIRERGRIEFDPERRFLILRPGETRSTIQREGSISELKYPPKLETPGPIAPGNFVAFATAPHAITDPRHFKLGYDLPHHNEVVDSIIKSIPPRTALPRDWWESKKPWAPLRIASQPEKIGINISWQKHSKTDHQVSVQYHLNILPGDRVQLNLDPAITAGMDIPSHIKTFYLFLQRVIDPQIIPLEIPITPQSDGTCSGAFVVDLDQLQIKNQEFDALNVFSTSQGSSPLWLEDYSRQKRIPGKF
ncbi:MAG: hypothetical protein IPN71_01315 [Fibrobacteres bacterium]|nr:hypothetical protein [Fibrobacterota bacterium]